MPVYRSLNHHFFKVWTPAMAYVLGYFAADGSMLLNNRGAHFIEFTSVDRVLIDIVQESAGSNHSVSVRNRGGNSQKAYRLQVGSKSWFEDLASLGFEQNKSLTMRFPSIPEAYLGSFVRGYFDGDGCVYFGTHFAKDRNANRYIFTTRFTSGSLTFLEELHASLKGQILKGGHISAKSKGGYDLVFSWYDSLALYRLMYHTGKVAGLFLPRKREKLEHAIQVLGLDKHMQL